MALPRYVLHKAFWGREFGITKLGQLVSNDVLVFDPRYGGAVIPQTLTDAATIAWNMEAGIIATVTLTANRTLGTPTNRKAGVCILHVIQGGSGSYTLAFPAIVKWAGGVAPVLSTAVGARDVISLVSDGTNLYGSVLLDAR